MSNSRERVLMALNHREPDRVPIDFGGHRSSGISAIAYAKLKQALGITGGDIYVYDIVQQLAIVEDSVLDAFDIDVIELGRGFLRNDVDWQDWVLPNGTPCKIPAYVNVEKRDADLAQLKQGAKALRESTDRAILGIFGGNLFEVPQMLYRMDKYLMYMALYPEATERLSAALCEIYLERLEKWLGAVGPYIDIVLFGDDLGGQQGPLISVEMYRRFYKPYHRKMWQRAKELADVKVQLHCCGSIEPLPARPD